MVKRRNEPAVPAKTSNSLARWGLPLTLVLTAIVFWPALRFQFVYDDRVQVAANPSIYSWSHVPEYFLSQIWGFAQVWTSYYRPLFLLAFRVCHSIVGLDTVGWHAFPILTHLLNIELTFLLARKLTGDAITALIAAALFAVHPVQLESVACIYGMTDSLMAVWLLSAFLCYLHFRENGRAVWLIVTMLLFLGGLLTKESAIVFPLVILVYESLRRRQGQPPYRRGILILFLSMIVVATAYLAVRRMVLGITFGTTAVAIPWSTVVYTAPSTLLRFLRFLFVPYGMSSFYDSSYVTSPGIQFIVPSLALILIATGIWLWSRRTTSLLAFLATWALLAVLPVLNIRVMQQDDFIHTRFLYIPCFALALLVAIALRQLLPSLRARITLASAFFLTLAVSTAAQIGYFASNETIYRRGIDIAPDNRVPKNNLADDYIKQGRDDLALPLLQDVLRRHPNFWMANYNVGYIAYKHQDWPKVADFMQRSISNHGEEVDAYVYRGYALLKLGRTREAEQSIRQAITLRPVARSYHFVLGLVLRQEQRWPEALAAFQNELEINPADKGAAQHVADLKARLNLPK